MPGLLSATELASIQSAASATLDKPCEIWRDTSAGSSASSDIYGSSTSAPSNTASYTKIAPISPATLNCSVNEPTGTHLQNFDFIIGSEATWMVRLPVGTDIRYRDHVVVESQILEVHVVLTPRSYPALTTVLCAEIK